METGILTSSARSRLRHLLRRLAPSATGAPGSKQPGDRSPRILFGLETSARSDHAGKPRLLLRPGLHQAQPRAAGVACPVVAMSDGQPAVSTSGRGAGSGSSAPTNTQRQLGPAGNVHPIVQYGACAREQVRLRPQGCTGEQAAARRRLESRRLESRCAAARCAGARRASALLGVAPRQPRANAPRRRRRPCKTPQGAPRASLASLAPSWPACMGR